MHSNKFRSELLKIVMIVLLSCAASIGASHAREMDSAADLKEPPAGPDTALRGRWRFGAKECSLEIGPSGVDHRRWSISVCDRTVAELSRGQYVRSVGFDAAQRFCVAHVRFLDSDRVGIWHEALLLIERRADEQVVVARQLEDQTLRLNAPPYYRIMDVGSVADYPLVDLFVGIQGISPQPALVHYMWVRWDLESGNLVGPIASQEAEARLRTARTSNLAYPIGHVTP